ACVAEGSAAMPGGAPSSQARARPSPICRRAGPARPLPRRITAVLVLGTADQHLPASDVVGRADVALGPHALDQAGGAVVAGAQAPLQIAGRRLTLLGDDLQRLGILGVVAVAVLADRQAERA